MTTRPQPRADLHALRAYLPETPVADVRLHANENPYPPPADVMDEIVAETARLSLNRYPDHAARELREELGRYCGVDPEWIWVGTGSNEILLDACLAYGGPGRTALLFEPTYSMHHRQATIAGCSVEGVRRRADFTLDVDEALGLIGRLRHDVVFVCNPNNPTGTPTPLDDVRRIARACKGLCVVDEAYYEFCGATLAGDVKDLPNVIVVRTLSKAFRLAGARLGYGIAQPETLAPLLKVRMPYSQSSLTQAAAVVAVRRRERLLARVPDIVIERERIYHELAGLPEVEVFGSEANFVLFRHPEAAKLGAALADRGILVRDFTTVAGCEGCLRVTAGTPHENDAFLAAMAELV